MIKTRYMPTAGRLVGAVSLGALGWFGSDMVRPLMPDYTSFGWFNYVNLVLGILCGWFVMGSRAGRGWGEAISNGLTGLFALVFWGFFAQSFNLMLKQSLEKRFEGPVEAILGMFKNAAEYAAYLVDPMLIATLTVGGMASGLVTEIAARRWS